MNELCKTLNSRFGSTFTVDGNKLKDISGKVQDWNVVIAVAKLNGYKCVHKRENGWHYLEVEKGL